MTAATVPGTTEILSAAELKSMHDQWTEFRRFRRKPVILASALETANGITQCVALDLSLGGARVRLEDTLEPEEQVTLVLPRFGRFPGRVVWRKGIEAGLQFSDLPEQVARQLGTTIPFK